MIRKLMGKAAAAAQDPFVQGMAGLLLSASFKAIAAQATGIAQRLAAVETHAATTLHWSTQMADAAERHQQGAAPVDVEPWPNGAGTVLGGANTNVRPNAGGVDHQVPVELLERG